jgi:putative hydrolase of the HAD superfamily
MTLLINHQKAFSTSPKAIIFDTDNTLYAYDYPHQLAMKAVNQKACKLLLVTPDDFNNAYTQARDQIKKHLGKTASSHSRLLYFQRAIEILGMKTQLLMTLDLEQSYWRTFLGASEIFPGAQDFVQDLRTAGIRTAIVTDLTAQIQFRKIIYFGLDNYFDYVVTSEEAGADKPAKAPFEIALDKLQVRPENCWMIGDSAHADIAGARSVNIVTIQKRHAGVVVPKGNEAADAVFDHFSDLRYLLKSKGWIVDGFEEEHA